MRMDVVAGSGNDEFYTPRYAVLPILEHLKPSSKVWCPFDTEYSNFTKVLREHGHSVICTHIVNGTDFFDDTNYTEKIVEGCDYIISNPPYSLKNEVFERLFRIGKPFAMLVGVVGLFESKKRFDMFKNNQFEVMYFDKRIAYGNSYEENKTTLSPPFSSVYLCSKMLDSNIVFKKIEKNNTMYK